MRVLVFEPDFGGHRLTYARHVVQAVTPLPVEVTLALHHDAPASPAFAAQLASLQPQFTLDASIPSLRGGPANIAMQKVRALEGLLKRHRADHVYVPYADGLAQMIGLNRCLGRRLFPRDIQCEALLMRGGFAYPQKSRMNHWRAQISQRITQRGGWTVMHHLDPLAYEMWRNRGNAFAKTLRLMPEAVAPPPDMSKADARHRLNIPSDGRYIGCTGAIDRRKGVDLLIRAFAQASLEPTDRLLLVGKMEPVLQQMLDGEFSDLVKAGRILTFNRYVSEDELEAGLLAMDVVAAVYPRHIGSSHVIVRAAASGRLVLAAEYGWVGWATRAFGLGYTCDPTDPDALTAAIVRALDTADSYTPTDAAQRFTQFHTLENHLAHWSDRLRLRLGLTSDTNKLTWDWVMEGIPAA